MKEIITDNELTNDHIIGYKYPDNRKGVIHINHTRSFIVKDRIIKLGERPQISHETLESAVKCVRDLGVNIFIFESDDELFEWLDK